MKKFKIGDKVKVKNFSVFGYVKDNDIGEIVGETAKGYNVRFEYYGSVIYLDNDQLEEIIDKDEYDKTNTNFDKMDIKERFLTSLKKEPEKSFRRAGITDGDDFLTTDGKEIFLSWILQKQGMKFKEEVVDDILKEMKTGKKD